MRLLLVSLLTLSGVSPGLAQEGAGSPTVEDARIYLTWGAGYGLPGARSSYTRTCNDAAKVDTLYLSFDPGRSCSTFVGMTATIWFRSLDGDTLGPLWQSPGVMRPPAGMTVEYPRDSVSAHPFPWGSFGIGQPGYGKSAPNAARIKLVWAVAPYDGARVEAGKLYGLARILIQRPPPGSPGCDQPVCVGWTEGSMAYRPGDEPTVSTGVRYVGINAEGGELGCQVARDRASQERSARPQGKAKKAASGR